MTQQINKTEILAEEFAAWKSHPTTRKFLQRLFEITQSIKDNIGKGATVSQENANETQAKTCLAIGKISGLNEAIYFKPSGGETSEDG